MVSDFHTASKESWNWWVFSGAEILKLIVLWQVGHENKSQITCRSVTLKWWANYNWSSEWVRKSPNKTWIEPIQFCKERGNGWFASIPVSWWMFWMCYQPSGSHPQIFCSGFQIYLMVALFIMAENWVKSEVCVKWLRSRVNARRYLRTSMGCRDGS